MSDHLKLSDPNGDAELDKIASALEEADNRRFEQLKKHIQELERQLAERIQARPSEQTKPNNKVGARKDGIFKAISTAPSFNLTPVGPTMVPLPYTTTIDLSNSTSVASNVRFNGRPVYTLGSSQPNCKGDEHGSGGGVKSGTVNGEVKPTSASTTVRVESKRVVRDGDPCTMNGGNNPGMYVTVPPTSGAAPRDALATSNPPVKLETPAEESGFKKWLHHTVDEMKQAVKSPVEGTKGALKGIANILPNIGELLLKASKEQSAAEMDEAAITQTMFGQTDAAKTMTDLAAEARKQEASVDVPKFKMNNSAQEGGDAILTVVQLFAGGVGVAKGAAKSLSVLDEVSSAARATSAKIATESVTVADEAKLADQSSDSTGDGIRIEGHTTNPTTIRIETRSASTVNEAMIAVGNQPAWLDNTEVITEIVPAGTHYQMVVSEAQAQALAKGEKWFGNWATPEIVPTQLFARENLSILPEFKPDVSYVVTVETTAPQMINSGYAGPLGDYNGTSAQVEFLGQNNLKILNSPKLLPSE